ncbi:MAG TPA: hypothetical protein PLB21_15320, partial [Actinomycetota bacterium]|nr:hypothetical protein [Actinomycetota bacterium]
MSKEIAQTVGGKRIAWLLAIIAAFAVMATLTTQWRSSSAALPTTAVTVTQSTTSTVGGGAVAWTATFAFTPSGTQLATAGVNFALDFDDDLTFVSVTGAGTVANVSGNCALAAGNVVNCTATAAAYTNGSLIFNFTNPQAGAVIDGPANGISATVCMSDVTTVACTLPAGYTATNAVTVTPLTATNLLGDAETYTFALPIGYTCDSDNTVDSLRSCAAGDVNLGAGLTLVSGPTVGAASTAVATTVTVTVVNTNAASTGGTISLDVSATENGTGFISQEATKVYVAGELRHMADLAAPTGTISVIARRDVESNVRNSRHTICTFQQDTAIDLNNNGLYTDSGDVAPVAVQLPGLTLANLVVTNGGGYASTIDTDPTFSDVRIFVGDGTDTGLLTSTTTAGFLGATCVSWVS